MRDLLFLVHRIPYPPNKGDKIRSWNFLSRLAESYRVHVGCFVDDPHDWRHVGEIERIAENVRCLPIDRRRALARSVAGLATGAPLTVGFYRDRKMRRWVEDLTAQVAIDRVFVYSSSMIQYVPDRSRLAPGARVVVDFVDIDSDKWRQYAEKKSWPMRAVYAREARTLLAVETAGAAGADASVFVSEAEAELFRQLAPAAGDAVYGISNGVDFDHFDPASSYDAPFDPAAPNIVFTGAMDYWANVDAVCWFAEEILPLVRASVADAAFWVVGANPAPDVERIGRLPGVTVTGRVADVRPYLAHAAVAVAPLRVARGIQNKVLEAMAMERATVVTSQALEGIDAEPGREVVVADDPAAFAGCVTELLGADRTDLGKAARARVVQDYGWAASLERLVTILEGSAAK